VSTLVRSHPAGERGDAAPAFPNVVIPVPVSAVAATGGPFTLARSATVSTDVPGIGDYLAGILRTSTGFPLPVSAGDGGTIALVLSGAPASVGDQGYQLTADRDRVVVRAAKPAGLFAGVQTLLQLLPPAAQSPVPVTVAMTVPAGTVTDHPRFAYRGAMLDVARHFFTVDQVKRYIDEIAHYKINYLHLHLSDDQGWRIAIDGRPELTGRGASTEVGGGPGGSYTQADYSAIVGYAASRYIAVIPEIDMPGHTNAALASYPELNCDGKATEPYTGTEVGFSTLCTTREATYTFVDEVVGQLAKLTPGPYIHIGGDESKSTPPEEYAAFMERAQKIVESHGKTVIGWHEIASASLLPTTVAEYWDPAGTNAALSAAAAKGTKVIMAPANHAYLDQKYDQDTRLGLDWAGLNDVDHAYDWDPGTYLIGVPESAVLGVEAALWTETIVTSDDIDFMAFPRLPAIAELGWSPAGTHDPKAFRARLAAQGPRWKIMGIGFYRSPQVSWPAEQ
jgi:hexosaminidase